MAMQSLGDERRAAGLLLVLGPVLFAIAAGLPLFDQAGNIIYALPLPGWLAVIAANHALWQWANILFITATIVTVLGLALFASVLQQAGAGPLARLGMVGFGFGAILLVMDFAFRWLL